MLIVSFILILLTGTLIPAILFPAISYLECIVLSFPLGLGIITILIWLCLLFKLPLTPENLILAQLFFAAILLCLKKKHNLLHWKDIQPVHQFHRTGIFLIFILFGFSILFNANFPIFISDGIGYKIHGSIAVTDQNLFIYQDYIKIIGDQNRTLGFHLISGYAEIFNFRTPKLFQSLIYLSFVALFYLGLRKFVSDRITQGFTLLFASAPMVWWQSFLYLNNLLAGFYFFCGILFWLHAIHEKKIGYFLISSLGFMLSSWVRYEFIVFYGLFLANVYFWALKERCLKSVIYFISFPLAFSGVWAVYSNKFYSVMAQTEYFIHIFIFYLFSLLAFILIYKKEYQIKKMFLFIALILLATCLITFNSGFENEKIILILKVFLSKIVWNILNQSVWGFSILLVLLLPFYTWKGKPAQNFLFSNLVILFFGISFLLAVIMQKSTLLDYSVIDKIKFFFESPGKLASRSSAREHFAFFPALLLFLGICIGGSSSTSSVTHRIKLILFDRPWFNAINALIIGNLILILSLFLFPRMEFLLKHYNQSYKELLITKGSRDNVNIYQPTYKIVQAIRRLTPRNSAIILPYPYGALKWKKKPYDSLGVFATYDTLYPRVIYWEGFGENTNQSLPLKTPIYRVKKGDIPGEACGPDSWKRDLGYYNWFICREEKIDLSEYQ